MKIAFSTLACPDFSWVDIYSMAKDLGFNGIEIRGLGNEIFAPNAGPFTENQVETTKETLRKRSLEIPCFSSGCCLKYKDKFEQNINEIKGLIPFHLDAGGDEDMCRIYCTQECSLISFNFWLYCYI